MATVKEITSKCKEGNIQEAYELALADLTQDHNNTWAQRGMGWALYYKLKASTDNKDYQGMVSILDEFATLDMLSFPDDAIIFENVLFKVAMYVHSNLMPTDIETPAKLSTFFSRLRGFTFQPSEAYSFLLKSFLKGESWPEMADFLDWWNLDNLTEKDYTPFVTDGGRRLMTTAERAYIVNARVLLRINDPARTEVFLPKLNALMEAHPEMTYPGYFYGKLLVSLGENADETLRVVVPFVRKKSTEFWAWQLMSDVFVADDEKKLACLLRAVNGHTQENFLGKVRIKLASHFIQHNDLNRARHQIDAVVRCYASQGWRLPFEIEQWIHEPWIKDTTPDETAPIDYMKITDEILLQGTEEAVAIATYVNYQSNKTTLVYGYQKELIQKLRFKTYKGKAYRINYIVDKDGKPKVLHAHPINLPNDLDYAKKVEGTVSRRPGNPFAFLRTETTNDCYIPSDLVKEHNLEDGQAITGKIVYCFNAKKGVWNWNCVTIKKQKN